MNFALFTHPSGSSQYSVTAVLSSPLFLKGLYKLQPPQEAPPSQKYWTLVALSKFQEQRSWSKEVALKNIARCVMGVVRSNRVDECHETSINKINLHKTYQQNIQLTYKISDFGSLPLAYISIKGTCFIKHE
jgi:hypothetical protein